MPRDIRSYFTTTSTGKSDAKTVTSKTKKRRVISSDEDEVQLLSPVKRPKKTQKSGKHSFLTISDNEDEKQKIVSPGDIFGKTPIKRQEAPKITRALQKKEAKGHNDDDFEATLCQLDTSDIEKKYMEDNKPSKEDSNGAHRAADKKKETTPVKAKRDVDSSTEKKTPDKLNKEDSDKKHGAQKRKHSDEDNEHGKEKSPKKRKGSKAKPEISKMEVEPVKKEPSKNTETLDVYEERAEKRKQGIAMYQQYLQRGGARHPGSKEIPVGAEYCLAGLSFVITGVLDSLEREEADELIKKYGGRIVAQVSKKTDYVIVGDQPGPSKISKADSFNIPKIFEDDLLEMIRTRPAGKANQVKQSHAKSKGGAPHKSTDLDDTLPSPRKLSKEFQEEKEKSVDKQSPVKMEDAKEEAKKTMKLKSPIKKEHVEANKIVLEDKKKTDETREPKPDANKLDNLSASEITEALVEKYRPKTMRQILGQQGDKSNAKKLYTWLTNWQKNQSGKVKHAKPSPWAKNDDGAFFKAALLSGPPGIGKTTTVQVVCNELGFDLVEFNASDTRSKKLLQNEVSGILSNTTLKDYFTDEKKKPSAKHVLLMDEVDGMAGNEDRGGLQELINLIKSSDVPVVCICNDRNNPKMRTLANYTFDLRFSKPRLEQIRGAMKSICFKEKITISTEDLDRLIESTNQDIRQVINHLALFVGQSGEQEKTTRKHVNKDLKLGPWDVVKKVFSAEEHRNMSLHDKSDLFFHDYSIAPLFVQENYLAVVPKAPREELLERVAQAAESLSLGDMVEKSIRSNGSWSLLPVQACYSSVIPGSVMSGYIGGQINFPAWLGRNSKAKKFDRLTQEITVHARLTTGASKEAVILDYIDHLRDAVVRPLAKDGSEGVDAAVSVMNRYHLLREDLDSLVEISLWPGNRDPMQAVDSKVKAAFTRAYNKNSIAAPYAMSVTSKKKKAHDEDFLDEEEDEADSNDDEDNVDDDKMIKAKKPSASKKVEGKSKAGDKPKRGRGRGKGK